MTVRAVIIRPAVPADLAAVARITEAAFAPYIERIGRPPGPMTADHAAFVAAGQVWVATSGDEVAGYVVLVPEPDHLYLDTVAVSPAHRGTGVGGALLTFAEQEAVRRGLPEVRLLTNEKMTENLTLYPSLGYKETGRGPQNGYRRVFFTKQL